MTWLRKAFQRLHYPADVILQCVRGYLTYALSLRNLKEMIAERGVVVDHSTIHRWVIRLVPLLSLAFRRRKIPVTQRWRMDEPYSESGEQGGSATVPGPVVSRLCCGGAVTRMKMPRVTGDHPPLSPDLQQIV